MQEKDERDDAQKEGELQQEIQGQIARISVHLLTISSRHALFASPRPTRPGVPFDSGPPALALLASASFEEARLAHAARTLASRLLTGARVCFACGPYGHPPRRRHRSRCRLQEGFQRSQW